jgi:hypothetical protein
VESYFHRFFSLNFTPVKTGVQTLCFENLLDAGFRRHDEKVFGGTRFCASVRQTHAATTKRGPSKSLPEPALREVEGVEMSLRVYGYTKKKSALTQIRTMLCVGLTMDMFSELPTLNSEP